METKRKRRMTRSTPHDPPLNRDATNESQKEPTGDYTTLPTKGTAFVGLGLLPLL